jgi:hypothetical protein
MPLSYMCILLFSVSSIKPSLAPMHHYWRITRRSTSLWIISSQCRSNQFPNNNSLPCYFSCKALTCRAYIDPKMGFTGTRYDFGKFSITTLLSVKEILYSLEDSDLILVQVFVQSQFWSTLSAQLFCILY